MTRTKRRGRIGILAAYLVAGTFLLQLGACLGMALNVGASSFDNSTLLDGNELFLGLFAPCGEPNIQYVVREGFPNAGEPIGDVLYWEDDMIWDCPVTEVETDP